MSFKTFMERHLGDMLACVLVIVCALMLVISTIVFWILSPVVLLIYFWRKYNFWIILGTSLYLFIIAFLWGVGNTTNETIDIAAHLLLLGVTLGVASYAEKKVAIFEKMKFKKYLPYIVIAIFVVIIGFYYGALTANPVGDDAFLHVGKIQFITDNFPNINWNPYWYSGFDMFELYLPTYYFIVGLINVMTGVSVSQLMVFFLFFAMFLLGVSVYKFSKCLDLPWYVGVVFSLMFLLLPSVWGSTITGGAYLRSFSLPFYVISLIAVYLHVSRVNEKNDDWKVSFLVVFLLSFTFLLHLMIGVFAAVTTSLIYLLAVKGLKQKILALFKVFIPVGGLVSCFYLPLLNFYFFIERFGTNNLALSNFEQFFTISNPILLPFTLILVAVFIFSYYRHRPIIEREKISVLTVFLILSVYFLLFGWLPMPERAYLMAAYDYRSWFVFSLALFLITLSGLIYTSFSTSYSDRTSRSIQKNNRHLSLTRKVTMNENFIKKFLVITTIFMIFAAFTISLPTVNTINVNPDDPNSFVYGLSSAVNTLTVELPSNYRLTGVGRRLHAFYSYKYPQLEYALGRQSGSTHSYYDLIFKDRVFYRYNEDQLLYYDERVPIHSEVQYNGSNFYSSMFWMDWFGVDGIVKAPWENLQTLNEYGSKEQYFNTTDLGGDATYIQYIESSPVLVSTNATTVGVLTEEKDGESLYRAVFLTLGELNLNSQWVIPLKLDGRDLEDDLQYIDTILTTSDQYPFYEISLQKYVNDGGNLVIMDYEHNNSELKRAELSESGLIFYTRASSLTQCEGFEVIGKTEEGVVICRSTVGAGSITQSSVSIQELYEEASPVASAVLGTIISPDFELNNNSPQAETGHLSYRKNALGKVIHLDNETVMEFELMQNVTAQINFRFLLENEASTSATGLIQFELWNDGKTNDLVLALVSSETSSYLSYTLSNSSWTGWKTFSIPLASFIKSSSSLLNEFNGIDLVINTSNQSIGNNEDGVCLLKVRGLGFFEAVSASTYESLGYEWVRANQLVVSLGEGFGGGCLLWKESYVEYWDVAANPQFSGVRFYYAGPGLMFVYVPAGVEQVTFTMPLTEIRIAGISISIITLTVLLVLLLHRRRSL